MNTPIALTPLIAHIPHAVPVVIIWGIMLRFYFAQRKLKSQTATATQTSVEGRPPTRRVWAADDPPTTGPSGDRDGGSVLGRTPAGRL
jgi:hypothetical protein